MQIATRYVQFLDTDTIKNCDGRLLPNIIFKEVQKLINIPDINRGDARASLSQLGLA
jgi:hypothetical protein